MNPEEWAITKAIKAAVLEERERCAKIAEDKDIYECNASEHYPCYCGEIIAKKIRGVINET